MISKTLRYFNRWCGSISFVLCTLFLVRGGRETVRKHGVTIKTEWDGVDWKHLAQDMAVVNGNEPSGYTMCGEFLAYVMNHPLLKQGFAEWR
jgi:hypothetical protein